nr:hypothetical protein [Tanacetum cinerariifolium]
MMVQDQEDLGERSANPTDPYHTPTITQPFTTQPQKTKQHRKPKRKDTELPQTSVPTSVADEVVNEEMDDSLKRAATTATSLDAKQDRGVNTPRSGEDSLKLTELMELCTNLQQRVLALETTKTTQALEIDSLKRKVKNLERKKNSITHGLKRLYKVGLSARVESSTYEGGEEVFVAQQDEKVVEKEVDAAQIQVTTTATTPTISIDEATLAQALAELKHAKPKPNAKGIVFHVPKESTTIATAAIPKLKSQDNGKAKMIEEPVKLKKKDQI